MAGSAGVESRRRRDQQAVTGIRHRATILTAGRTGAPAFAFFIPEDYHREVAGWYADVLMDRIERMPFQNAHSGRILCSPPVGYDNWGAAYRKT